MKKLTYNLIGLCIVCSIFACSSDSENLNNFQETNLEDPPSSLQSKISNDTFKDYEAILDSLYASYTIMKQSTEIKDQGIKYYVTEVHVNSSLKGFFVEVPLANKAVYLDRNGDLVTLYNNSDTKNPVQTYDLTNDPLYAEIGFSPYQPENEMEGRKFFGEDTNTYTIACGECNCTMAVSTFYVFWIAVSQSDPILTGVDCS